MKYKPWHGLTIWIGGTILAIVLGHCGIVSRDTSTWIAAGSLVAAYAWSRR